DPYAIPALPHLDPNQLFWDDLYHGAIPQTFDQTVMGEAIPMVQLTSHHLPSPGLAYGSDLDGHALPGPHM
ncbi:hypothetical protein F5148DRAFT_959908, partial [Russula earlei]